MFDIHEGFDEELLNLDPSWHLKSVSRHVYYTKNIKQYEVCTFRLILNTVYTKGFQTMGSDPKVGSHKILGKTWYTIKI